MVLSFGWFNLRFFDFKMVSKQNVFSRKQASNFEFLSFPQAGDTLLLSHDAGQPQLPVSHVTVCVNKLYTPNHPVPKQPFSFSLFAVVNKFHEIFNTVL